mgnify:CR=1 FL=1
MSTYLDKASAREKTFAAAKPGELYRAPDGLLRRKPAEVVTTPVEPPARGSVKPQKAGFVSTKALTPPLRGEKPVRRAKTEGWIKRMEADLAERFPAFRDCLPLRIGVLADLVNAGVPQGLAIRFLRWWTARPEYHAAVAAPASRRFNLDGVAAGEIHEKHRRFAGNQLKEKEQ